MTKDNLILCPLCGSDGCYYNQLSAEYAVWACFGCGFTTNTLMVEGSEFYEEQMSVLPELYKDLQRMDREGRIWIPQLVDRVQDGMGTVFANGTGADQWGWSAALAVEIPEEDKERFRIPGTEDEYYQYKSDLTTMKHFGQEDFIEALDFIGAFAKA